MYYYIIFIIKKYIYIVIFRKNIYKKQKVQKFTCNATNDIIIMSLNVWR